MSTSAANTKSMVYVPSVVACWSRFVCSACHCDYCHNIGLGSPKYSQYITLHAPARVTADAQVCVIQRGPSVMLGKILVFGNKILIAAKLLKVWKDVSMKVQWGTMPVYPL